MTTKTTIGTGTLTYQWYFNNAQMSGKRSQNATLSIGSVGTSDAGNYTVTVNNNYGTVTSTAAALTIAVPPTITNQPASQALSQGQNATFSVGASGLTPFSYQWSINGTNISWATNAALTLTNIQPTDAASYSVVVSNLGGSAASAAATLMVYVPPAITNQPASQTVLPGQNATFAVAVASGGPTPFSTVVFDRASSNRTSGTLTWTHVTTNADNRLMLVGVSLGGVGNVSAITYGGSSLTKVIGVTNNPASSALWQLVNPPGGTNTVTLTLIGTPSTLVAGAATFSGVDQTMPLSATNSATASGTTSTNTITSATNAIIFDNLACDNGAPTSASAGQTQLWRIGGSEGGAASFKPGTNSATMAWTIPSGSWADLAVSVKPAAVGNVANWATPRYQWNVNGTDLIGATNASLTITNVQAVDAGGYFVVVTNFGGSVTSQVATLTVNILAGITTQPLSQTVAAGFNVNFSVVPSGTAPFAYQWTFNGTNLVGATNSTLTLNNVHTNNAGNYAVVVTNAAGSATSSSAMLTVNVPAGISTQPLSQTVVQGSGAVLSVIPSGTAPFGYQWTFNSTNLVWATNSTLSLANVQTNNSGLYTVVVNNSYGSVTSAVAVLTVIIPPTVLTLGASNVTTSSATLNATISPQGNPASCYFQYGVTTNYGSFTATNALPAGSNAVLVAAAFAGLTFGTLYHYAVVATSSGGTTAGADATFTTAYLPPAAITLAAANANTNSATLNATINPQRTAASYYFQYGLTTNYDSFTATNTLAADSNALAVATLVASLAPGTTYHYSIVAVSAGGTSIGADATFSTAFLPPMMITLGVSNVAANSAVLNATVNPQGTQTFCYFQFGLTTNYNLFTPIYVLDADTNSGVTSALIANLAPGTLYHYSVVAINSGGTNAGADATFTTAYLPPSAVTLGASNVTASSAVFFANLNPQGAVVNYFFLYGLTTNYGSFSATNVVSGSANVLRMSMPVTGLDPGTLYHYCVVAVGPGGTAMGLDATFTTAYLPPTVVTLNASSVTAGSAALNAMMNPQGAATTYYFQYGATTNYGLVSATNELSAGMGGSASLTVSGPVAASVTGLDSGTPYHYCIVAGNSGGTSYGQDATFTTLNIPPVQFTGTLAAPGGSMVLTLASVPGATFTVLAATNMTLPLSQWTVLGSMTETSSGQYQLTDSCSSTNPQCYYVIRSP